MGQRALGSLPRRHSEPVAPSSAAHSVCVFPTALGWFGLLGKGNVVAALSIGHDSAAEVRSALQIRLDGVLGLDSHLADQNDWHPRLRRSLEEFARGMRVEFDDVVADLSGLTDFQRRVLARTRRIGYGQTLSYGALAAQCGNPRAARAVGAALARNPVAVVIPCHRVIATGGALGGFSAPRGAALKRHLLELEQSIVLDSEVVT